MNPEAFIITNGRGSFEYTLKALENQSIPINIHVIKDHTWIDACNYALNYSDSNFYFRVDDDMILHPRACEYMMNMTHTRYQENAVMYVCKLWEPWNNRVCNKIKIYERNLTKKLGFRTDNFGKIDKLFKIDMKEYGLKMVGDKSPVGMHAAGSFEDNYRYSSLRGHTLTEEDIRYKEIVKLDQVLKRIPYEEQLRLAGEPLTEFNKKLGTGFGEFLTR